AALSPTRGARHMALKSGNPALSVKTFDGVGESVDPMTMPGTINKTAMLLAILLIGAGWVWNLYFASHRLEDITTYLWVGVIGGFVLALVTVFNKQIAPYTSPAYALLEGFAIGGVSALYEARHPGIALQAVGLTLGTLACMLAAYRFEIIKVTENFKMGVVAATGGIAILYLIDIVLMLFGHPVSFIHEGGAIGIAFSLFVVGLAALNLVMDFDFIAKGVAQRSPKYMEWYSAFGLVVTLVWLYVEILRLLGKRR
ncbi:MAG TPA: Bax inhibitor-1/YccA family protein, partial [Steroidobacteraceae bacterium]|nr:Bax inhibitor-1/YccA family protein [Steroidobacteraceae bacterium]